MPSTDLTDRDTRTTSGSATPTGGSTASPRAPTPSTRSRSCRWPPPSWPAPTRVLDIGCGDGQISRLAAAARRRRRWPSASTRRGTRSASRAERGGGPGSSAPAPTGLPFADGSFDAAVACLVFEHIDDVDAAIAEIARVLAPGGRFCFFLNHPLLQTPGSGWIDDQILDPPEQYWRIGPYLAEAVTVEEVELACTSAFVHRPLSRYVNALAADGLLLDADGRAGAAARLPRPRRRVRGRGDGAPPARTSVRRKRRAGVD